MAQQPKTNQATDFALMRKDMDNMAKDMADIKLSLNGKYVTQDQFWPIKTLVYGATGIMLVAIIVAIVGLVIARAPT